uniref:V-set and immunoglobulin domain containing 2 n=1 Tax=Crocodylus porosus TaxID=8502 RepID=A0A7M4DX22_CROPO
MLSGLCITSSCFTCHIFSTVYSGPCVEVTIPTDQVMQKEGSSVELCCHYKTSVSKNFILEWRFIVEAGPILYFTNNMLYKPGSQASRLSLLQSPPTTGDATIRLDNVRTSDAGTYICEVNNPPDFYGSGSGLIHFTVLSKSTNATKGPTLLVWELPLKGNPLRHPENKKDSQSTYTGNELREDATAPGITETSLQRRDSDPGNRFLERPSSQAESMSTTKSRLNIVV